MVAHGLHSETLVLLIIDSFPCSFGPLDPSQYPTILHNILLSQPRTTPRLDLYYGGSRSDPGSEAKE